MAAAASETAPTESQLRGPASPRRRFLVGLGIGMELADGIGADREPPARNEVGSSSWPSWETASWRPAATRWRVPSSSTSVVSRTRLGVEPSSLTNPQLAGAGDELCDVGLSLRAKRAREVVTVGLGHGQELGSTRGRLPGTA